jgi:hypothetical protein
MPNLPLQHFTFRISPSEFPLPNFPFRIFPSEFSLPNFPPSSSAYSARKATQPQSNDNTMLLLLAMPAEIVFSISIVHHYKQKLRRLRRPRSNESLRQFEPLKQANIHEQCNVEHCFRCWSCVWSDRMFALFRFCLILRPS